MMATQRVFKVVTALTTSMVAGLSMSMAFALGLGSLEVQSNLDQPLDGIIELRLAPGDEVASIDARIASREEFEDLGIDYPEYLGSVRLLVEDRAGVAVLRLLSDSIINEVKIADMAIFVGGLDATWEGEEMPGGINVDGFYNGDRTKIELPEIQQKAIKDMVKTGTPVVLVLMAGSSIALNGLEKELEAVLMAWYPGQRGGNAITSVLFGDYNPSGKLPVTFYSSTAELPDFKDYNMQAGKGFTYRYYKGEALYPFGHGLSYTNFKYSKLRADKTNLNEKENFKISFNVKNIGDYDGDEVVQVYIKDLESKLKMPIKQLRSFKRISLNKGDEKIVEFEFKPIEDFSYYDADQQKYMVDKGSFEIQVGSSSQDIRLKKIIYVD